MLAFLPVAGWTQTIPNLNLVSEHDMTWNMTIFSSARAGLDRIASQLKALAPSSFRLAQDLPSLIL
jgi:hypothetical protein